MSLSSVANLIPTPTPASTAGAANAKASTSVMGSLSTFLNILTTQLTHQDPTSATDTNQFTQELVQFAQVEQQLNTNTDLTQLINLQQSSGGLTQSLNYIGQYAEIDSPSSQVVLQSGSAEAAYAFSALSTSTSIEVQNSAGVTVATLNGSGNPGVNYVKWDGKDSNGNQLPDGLYKFKIVGHNTDGTTQNPTAVGTFGKVTGVTSNNDGTYNLSIGNSLSIATSNVAAIFSAGNLPAATTNAG